MITECLHYASIVSGQIIAPNPPILPLTIAYLDPGTGSLIIQMAIGALVGGLVGLKVFWKQFTGFCKNLVGGSKRNGIHN